MPRRTHRTQPAGHSRAHVHEQAGRWRARRMRRALDTDRYFLAGAWSPMLRLPDGLDASVDALRADLEAVGQRGPLYHAPPDQLAALPTHVRRMLLHDYTRPPRVEHLDQRGRYERAAASELYDWVPAAHPSHRAAERRRWQAEVDEDLRTDTPGPRPPRRKAKAKCARKAGSAHRYDDWSYGTHTTDGVRQSRACMDCGRREHRHLTYADWHRERALADRFSRLNVWTRLYGPEEADRLFEQAGGRWL